MHRQRSDDEGQPQFRRHNVLPPWVDAMIQQTAGACPCEDCLCSCPFSYKMPIDRRILRILQEDGRLTNVELADRVGLSPSPCLRRIKRLEEEGIIKGYRAVLDRRAVSLGLTIFTEIKVDRHTRANADALQRHWRPYRKWFPVTWFRARRTSSPRSSCQIWLLTRRF